MTYTEALTLVARHFTALHARKLAPTRLLSGLGPDLLLARAPRYGVTQAARSPGRWGQASRDRHAPCGLLPCMTSSSTCTLMMCSAASRLSCSRHAAFPGARGEHALEAPA